MSEWMLLTVLVLTGLVLIAVDFYLPGFILGSIGVVLLIVSLFVCKTNHGWPATIGLFVFELFAGILAGYLSIRYIPQTAMGRKMILGTEQTDVHTERPAATWVGRSGVAHTVLRPAGVAVIDGKRLDALAESGMIEAGSPIRVVAIKDNNLIVKKI